MEKQTYYLVFTVDRIPDLTLVKYSVLDGSSVDDIIDKHSVFLRQLHRLGSTAGVYFHLLYYFDPDERIPKGHHLSVVFYATSTDKMKLDGIREFLTTSVLSTYYDFHCYEVSTEFAPDVIITAEKREENVIRLTNIADQRKVYGIREKDKELLQEYKRDILQGKRDTLTCEIASDGDAVLSFNSLRARQNGQVLFARKHVLARKLQVIDEMLWLSDDNGGEIISEAFECELSDRLKQFLTEEKTADEGTKFICYFEPDGDKIVEIGRSTVTCDENGKIVSIEPEMEQKFSFAAFLTKRDYFLPAQNRLNTDGAGEVNLYSIMEWEPCEDGRLYNVLKLMEGYNRTVALRIDIFPVEHTQRIREKILPYADTRRRIAERNQGKDDNSENIIKSWDKYLQNLMKYPQFFANVVAFADSEDVAVMLADSVAAEAVESGTYLIEQDYSEQGFSVYYSDDRPLEHLKQKEPDNYVGQLLSLYTLEEVRPMFSFPILYQGESIECLKETDPKPFAEKDGEAISLGVSSLGYDVEFPVKLFKKHAFIAGVPGAGKTNTMLHLVTSLWRGTHEKIPFLVLEPAKQEYRALAKIEGMEELRVFSPGADTYVPLHINPFQFPVGLTLAEHIANLNAVFAGAFELPPPSPHFIDTCIEKVYLDKGWNVNERNVLDKNGNYRHEFPTLQELYASLEVAVKNSHYEGETLGNLQSVLEVRVGSLLKREIGNVYNVRESILKPEEWLDVPAIIELEALGEGPANFMSLLLSTLIRETLKVRKTSEDDSGKEKKKTLNHVIFYEEAHNLIGPDTDSPMGDSVDPKISATKYVVKMLAEVRALEEGIVIADQLPTVMAPEVLKNTGLKIAHRITAQDDRNLLGSTMSASPDQLEEQGTFGTGWALIFYEDLLKPYKMKVHEWDITNKDKNKYESPTNKQLLECLKDNLVYRASILKSAEIMKDKMEAEYSQLSEKAGKIKENIDKEVRNLKAFERGIESQKSDNSENTTSEDAERRNIDISRQRLAYKEKKERFLKKYGNELHRLCWDYTNQYYASVTLAKNYAFTTDLLYVTAVSGFLSVFVIMRSLVDTPELAEIIIEDTRNAMDDVRRFVSLDMKETTLLRNHKAYDGLIFESGYYWVNEIYLRTKKFVAKAERIVKLDCNREQNIRDFCEDWTGQFIGFMQMADIYAQSADVLADEKEKLAKNMYLGDTLSYEDLMSQANEIKKRKYAIYNMLNYFVITPIQKVFMNLRDADRISFLRFSAGLREKYRELVDYLDGRTATKLSECSIYKVLRQQATVIVNMELLAKIEMIRADRIEKIEQFMVSGSIEEKEELIKNIRNLHNACFKIYRNYDVERYDYKVILVNFYMQYLDAVMNCGKSAVRLISNHNLSRIEREECSKIIQKLRAEQLISESHEIYWNRVCIRWKKIVEAEK